jgi:uracil-DNA glycosylase
VHQAQFGALSLPVVATYHPAYLLRSPAEKARAWADLCLALDAHARLVR